MFQSKGGLKPYKGMGSGLTCRSHRSDRQQLAVLSCCCCLATHLHWARGIPTYALPTGNTVSGVYLIWASQDDESSFTRFEGRGHTNCGNVAKSKHKCLLGKSESICEGLAPIRVYGLSWLLTKAGDFLPSK